MHPQAFRRKVNARPAQENALIQLHSIERVPVGRIDGAAVSAGLIVGLGVVAAASGPTHRRVRVQGLLVLGIVKFSAPQRGDVRVAKKLMDRYAASDDPLEAAAAKAARELTREDFRRIGTQY